MSDFMDELITAQSLVGNIGPVSCLADKIKELKENSSEADANSFLVLCPFCWEEFSLLEELEQPQLFVYTKDQGQRPV